MSEPDTFLFNEPWKIQYGKLYTLNGWYVTRDLGAAYARMDGSTHAFRSGEEMARRIRACVNACAGLPTEWLESLDTGALADMVDTSDADEVEDWDEDDRDPRSDD